MELAQSQSEYEASLATIPQLETQIAQQEDALSVLLGAQSAGRSCAAANSTISRCPSCPAGLPSELLERRPDLRQAEQNLVAANALIGAARALYFPSISLTGLFGTASGQFSKLFTGPARVWSYRGRGHACRSSRRATSPVRCKQAEAQQQQALLHVSEGDSGRVPGSRRCARSRCRRSREQLAVQGRQVDALRTYSRLARLRYEGGYTSYIEVLDAERSLFNAQLELYADAGRGVHVDGHSLQGDGRRLGRRTPSA